MNRLTLQGALRYDHPWSWFPEQVEPAGRFFPGATFAQTDGVTGYNDITPRMGAAYDVFGNGKTALKVSLGKYLQGASVSNLAYNANPALRIPFGGGSRRRSCVLRSVGFGNPCVSRELVRCELQQRPRLRPDQPAGERRVRPDRQPAVRLEPARRRAGSIRNCSAAGACVRPTGRSACRCSRSSSRGRRWKSATTAGRSRMFTTGGTVTDNLRDLAERLRVVHAHGAERPAPARRWRLRSRPALRHQPERVRSVEQLLIKSDEGRRRRHARVQRRRRRRSTSATPRA